MPLCPIFGAPYYNYGIIYLQNPILIIQTPIIEARIVTSMVPYDIGSITYIESLLFPMTKAPISVRYQEPYMN